MSSSVRISLKLVKDLMIENQEIIIANLKEENKRLKLESISKKYYNRQEGALNKTNLEKSKTGESIQRDSYLPLIEQGNYGRSQIDQDDYMSNENFIPSKERADNLEEISVMMKRILDEN
jgi:hypothetical protein